MSLASSYRAVKLQRVAKRSVQGSASIDVIDLQDTNIRDAAPDASTTKFFNHFGAPVRSLSSRAFSRMLSCSVLVVLAPLALILAVKSSASFLSHRIHLLGARLLRESMLSKSALLADATSVSVLQEFLELLDWLRLRAGKALADIRVRHILNPTHWSA